MPVSLLHKTFKAVCVSGVLSVSLATTGCWEEVNDSPDSTPTPTPTPFPSPTATPAPTPTPTSTPSQARSIVNEGDVALNNADIVEAAARDAVAELTVAETALASESIDSTRINAALTSIESARQAFFVVEVSLYYTDPENNAELEALPPKLATALSGLKMPGFDDLAASLASRASGASGTSDSALRAAAKSLREDLETLVASWSSSSLGNFRNGIFLPDPDADGRICQGIATMADILVLSSLESGNAEIRHRLWAMKYLLEGSYEGTSGVNISGVGILDLVSGADAALAASIEKNLNSIINGFENSQVPSGEAASALEHLHDEISSMADVLGYEPSSDSP